MTVKVRCWARSAAELVGVDAQTAHSYGYDDLNRLVSGSASGGECASPDSVERGLR